MTNMASWIYRFIGKQIAKKTKLEDIMVDTPTPTESIPWYKSRTIWAAVVTVIIGGITPISTAFGHPIQIPEWVLSLLVGMGLYTARVAKSDIK